jgi:hypothetical protein
MQYLQKLGKHIEQQWRELGYRHERFADLALTTLQSHAPHEQFSVDELVRWFCANRDVPPQAPDGVFGEPPIAVFESEHFYLEVLFWLDGTTAIHQHAFSGAFHVLGGSSIHTRYTFEEKERLGPELLLGDLRARPPELLHKGATRQIHSGDGLIHSLFHLDRPSVTLVARTRKDPGADLQYSYFVPGIAHSPSHEKERYDRILRLFGVMRQSNSPHCMRTLSELVESGDLHTATMMILSWFRRVPPSTQDRDRLLALVARRHATLARYLEPAIEEARRQALIIDRRKTLHRPEHRFFLSLLLNIHGRERILRLVEEQYPGRPAIDQIVDWVEQMATLPASGDDASGAPNALGYDFGEAEVRVFGELLAGGTVDEVIGRLAKIYDGVAEQAEELRGLCKSVQESVLFHNLLAVDAVERDSTRG